MVDLTDYQFRRLRNGHQIQLKHHQIDGSGLELKLHHENHKKLQKAHRLKKGVRLQLSKEEIEAAGLMDFIKKAGRWIKRNIIDTPAYQKVGRPIVRGLVDTALKTPIGAILQEPINDIGRATNAYGLKGKRGRKKKCIENEEIEASSFRVL
jgi:hypothetical protein